MNRVLIILFIILFVNCGKNVELSDEERNWNPYRLNETLVFESSNGLIDSLTISELDDNIYPDGPGPMKYYEQKLWIFARQNSILKHNPKVKILEISAESPRKPSEIGFLLSFENARFAGWGFEIHKLKKYPTLTISTKAGKYEDVIKLESVMYYPDRENDVQFMYWSKKNGYVKFERKDGLTWELIKKYVP